MAACACAPAPETSVDTSLAREGFVLSVQDGKAKVVGGSDAGVFYGLKTLSHLEIANPGPLRDTVIAEEPAIAWRGVLLDCSRHFYTVDEVKKFIDIIAEHRMNTFHWHICDDQGWRIEIKKYPLLTKVGSVRKETLVGDHRHSNEYDGTPYGGYYTQRQIREIVRYASKRFVNIVPEIDLPGHSQAAMASYPWLACEGKEYEVGTRWGVSTASVCIGKETTFQFYRDVLGEVCDLFPGEFIDIGGDEVRTDNWKECPYCQQAMRDHGFEDESQLQGLITIEMEKFLAERGKRIVGWEEILGFGVSDKAVPMAWHGPQAGIKYAQMGIDAVMSPYNYMYFDYYQTDDPVANGEPFGFGEKLPLEKVCTFDPYDQLETQEQRDHIIGVQANLWTEYIGDFEKAQFFLMPRLAAVAEITWTGEPINDFEAFRMRLKNYYSKIYDHYGYTYAKYAIPE